jgi:hypothetical protein
MGPVKDVQTANDDNTMAARGDHRGDGFPDAHMEPRPHTDGAASSADNDANYADNAVQAEEPGYGYGV